MCRILRWSARQLLRMRFDTVVLKEKMEYLLNPILVMFFFFSIFKLHARA
eukprot:m.348546 g.348546  ORF g.348546 m.348546 type:complete len:50 (+) comp37754_c0_seq1:804-953(+)